MITPNIDDYILFQDMLERNYFNDFKKGNKTIEFLLSTTHTLNICSNCENKNSDLYPQQDIFIPTQTSKFQNLKLLLNWYIENKFQCDIHFNGQIENEDINEILVCLEYLKINLNYTDRQINIIFNTKMKNFEIISQICKSLTNTCINPIFYIHLNGYYCEPRDDYSQILNYIKNKNCFYFKLDITPENIKNWINNYKWWILNFGLNNFLQYTYLDEHLNNNWNYESIQDYLNFLDFQIDFLYENLTNFNQIIFYKNPNKYIKSINISLIDQEILTNKKYYQDCQFHHGLTIDLTTLKLPACSKLNYPIYHIGEFKYENNKLTLIPLNISLVVVKAHFKRSSTPHCEYCKYLNICEKTCYGENFLVSYNPLCPIKNSCEMLRAKYSFLIYKYSQMNLFDLEQYNLDYAFKNDLIQLQKIIEGFNHNDILV